jgi:hypothetical protein
MARIKETEIGRSVVAWLRDMGWEVYQEVGALNADIIAVLSGKFIWSIECKPYLNFKVLNQAIRQSHNGQWSSIAVPQGTWRNNGRLAKVILDHYGLGCLLVSGTNVTEQVKARMRRQKTPDWVWGYLDERQKTYCDAGSPGGRAWSPFKATCEELLTVVRANPGIRLDVALKRFNHHYKTEASAKRSMATWIGLGKVKGIESRLVDRKLCLFPLYGQVGS